MGKCGKIFVGTIQRIVEKRGGTGKKVWGHWGDTLEGVTPE